MGEIWLPRKGSSVDTVAVPPDVHSALLSNATHPVSSFFVPLTTGLQHPHREVDRCTLRTHHVQRVDRTLFAL
jgi:hypothetical protein